MPGKGRLSLTGQLGSVMKESAEIALSYVRTKAELLGIDPSAFQNSDVHLHVPAGALPKDGPSAGVAMVMTLASLFSDKPVRSDVGITGEITLSGRVLPVGGIKMKALAAHRAGLKTVILPRRNNSDVEELPDEVSSEMTFVTVDHIDEAIAEAFIIPILPVRSMVAFPQMNVPFMISFSSASMIDDAMKADRTVGLLTVKDPEIEHPVPGQLYEVGTIAKILHAKKDEEGVMVALLNGIRRFKVSTWQTDGPHLKASVASRPGDRGNGYRVRGAATPIA